MKILIFSDSHLTHKFNKELFDYISKIIKGVDQVIINGDFWDAYLTSFRRFKKSKWKKLFPLLKEKNAVYIFGNHDKKKFMGKDFGLFSVEQAEYYEFKSGNRDFYVTHGHLMSPTYDNILFFRNPLFVRFLYKLFVFLKRKIISSSKKFVFFDDKKHREHLKKVKDFTSYNKKSGQFFIFGHSHIPFLEISENFISLGQFQSKNGSYCLIENGYIDLIKK